MPTETDTPTFPKELNLVGSLDIQAAKGKEKYPTFSLVANTGQPMKLPGFFAPVIVNLPGARFAKRKTPVIAEHETGLRIGHTLIQTVDRDAIRASGIVSSKSATAKGFVEDSKAGFPFEVSIGSDIDEASFTQEGETVNVNGKDWQGPLIVAQRVSIRELSICVLGADGDTSAIVAKRYTPNKESTTMPNTALEARRKELAAEEYRVDQIRAAANQYPNIKSIHHNGQTFASVNDFKMHAIESNMPWPEFELLCRRADYPTADRAPQFRATREYVSAEAIQCVMLRKGGFGHVADRVFAGEPQILEAADKLRHLTLPDICEISLHAHGKEPGASRTETIQMAMRLSASDGGFTTLSLANLLGGSADKLLGIAFQEAGATWRSFGTVKDIPNFREHKVISPYAAGQLEKVGETGVIGHETLLEDYSSLKVDTYASMLRIGRQTLINDDLNWMDSLYSIFAVQAARKLNDLVYEVLMGNAGNFFHANNKNLLSGGESALSKTSLASAIEMIRTQRDGAGNDLDFVPKVAVVPPNLETTLKEIINSTEVEQTEANTPRGNALLKALKPEVESRLSNAIKWPDTASENHWFVFCGPESGVLNVGFLDGAQGPKVEFLGLEHQADRLGVAYRVYADFGVGLGQPKAGCRSDGE